MRNLIGLLVLMATVINAIAVVALVALLGSTGAWAQEKVSLNCSAPNCVAVATWSPPIEQVDPEVSPLTGCVLYIDGAPYAGSSTVTVPLAQCEMPMPALAKGVYTLRAAGVNSGGEGAQSAPLILGTPVGRPENLQRRPHR